MNSFYIIYDWMLNLGLSPTSLLAFAIIYSFCVGGDGIFRGSRDYLAIRMGTSKRTVDGALSRLLDKGLIIKSVKKKIGGRICEYTIIRERLPNCTEGAETAPPTGAEVASEGATSAPNNKDNRIVSTHLREIVSKVCPYFGLDFISVLEMLAAEPAWRDKSENQWRVSLQQLANKPEVEACAIVRKTIERGWKYFSELKADEKNARYGTNEAQECNARHGGAIPHKPEKLGIVASEAIVAEAMRKYNA